MKIASITWSLIFLLGALSAPLQLSAENYDPSASVFLFQKQMAKRGNAESQYKLGLMYETGSGTNNSPVLASSWYKKAARQNYKPASNRLTYLEIKKNGFADLHQQWLKELKSEARFNDGEALFLLGQMYSEGTGVNKSLTRSLKYLRKAAGGNIPGSEAEINRVETELVLLQKQYITEKDKTKLVPIVAVVAPKAVKAKPIVPTTVSTKKVKAKQKKTKPIQSTNKKVTRKKTHPKTLVKQQPTSNKLQVAKTSAEKKTDVIKTTPVIEPHPMDSICGGRNRFNRGCR